LEPAKDHRVRVDDTAEPGSSVGLAEVWCTVFGLDSSSAHMDIRDKYNMANIVPQAAIRSNIRQN